MYCNDFEELTKEKEETEAAMKSSEAKEKEIGKLEKVYNNLERDWNAYKQSKFRTRRTRNCTDSRLTVNAIQLFHNSPRHLMSQLQGTTAGIIDDVTKLKGRRLFEAMEEEDEMAQVIRSLSFCDSEDEAKGCEGSPHSSSSSSPLMLCEEEVKVEGTKDSVCEATDVEKKKKINGGRYIIMLGGFCIALLIFAIRMRTTTSYGGFEGVLVPT